MDADSRPQPKCRVKDVRLPPFSFPELPSANNQPLFCSARELRADAIEARLAKLAGKRPIDELQDDQQSEDDEKGNDDVMSEDGDEREYVDVDEIDRDAREAMRREGGDEVEDGKGDLSASRVLGIIREAKRWTAQMSCANFSKISGTKKGT